MQRRKLAALFFVREVTGRHKVRPKPRDSMWFMDSFLMEEEEEEGGGLAYGILQRPLE